MNPNLAQFCSPSEHYQKVPNSAGQKLLFQRKMYYENDFVSPFCSCYFVDDLKRYVDYEDKMICF